MRRPPAALPTIRPPPTDRRRWLALAAATALPVLPGCGTWTLPRPGPMDLLHLDAPGPTAAPTLLVMLPGAYSAPQEFVDEGFVRELRERPRAVDVVIAGATIAHYVEGRVLDRLHDEVIAPARARGVRAVWLAGVSLGGLFALGYASRHGDGLSGVLTLAPYLGRRTLLAEIAAAGGAEAWAAQRAPQPDDLLEHEVWAWLARRPTTPPLFMGYGRDDRFADAHRVLATRLPAGRAVELPGGHDWPVWRVLWRQWLAEGWLDA